MSGNWETLTLDDVCEKITDGAHNSPKSVEIGKPMASVKDLTRFGVDLKEARLIAEEEFNKLVKQGCKPEVGDVLIAKDGNSALDTVCSVDDELDAVLLSSVAILRPDPKKITTGFLKYYFCSKDTISYLKSNFISGAAIPRVVLKDFRKAEISLPSLTEQKQIAKILGDLDDKIALNTQINQTLEAMAQALFKSWFVDFDPVKAKMEARASGGSDDAVRRAAMAVISGKSNEELVQFEQENPEAFGQLAATADLFPEALVESELGLIPEGWGVKTVGDVANTTDYVANGSFAALKENVTLYDEPNEILYVRTTDYNSGFSGNLKYTDRKSYEFLKKSTLFGRETIISNVGDVGTVFRAPVWLNHPMTLGSNAVAVISENHNSYLFWLFRSDYGQQLLDSIVTGSAQLKFNKTNLRSLRILWPTDKILTLYEKHEKLLHQKSISINGEIEMLKSTRDTLLPKLLSGEIDLSSFGDGEVGE